MRRCATCGVLNAHEITDAVAADEDTDLGSPCTPVAADAQLGSAMRLLDGGADAVPVTDGDDVLVGWIRLSDILAVLGGRTPAVPTQA